MRSRSDRRTALFVAALALSAGPALAEDGPQTGAPGWGFGTAIDESALAAWNIDIRTVDGQGLPAGRGTARAGQAVFAAKCATCHGERAEGGPMYGPMVGGIGSFATKKRVLTPGSMYPYAPILFDYIRRAMPMDAPQSLTNDEVYAVSAYILQLNGLIGEDEVLDASSVPAIEMPNRDGFILDDRPDTHAIRCLSDCTAPITFESGG